MYSNNVTQKLIKDHLIKGELIPGKEIGIRIDQALLQDATGTLVQLELEAMGLQKAKTEIAVQYVDHNLLQTDHKNADDHLFLLSAAQRFGLWYSRPGNGVSHPVHMERFGIPGKTLLGSDSHTCAAGSLGMLAIGTGGLDVASVIAGEPYYVKMPEIMGVKLTGKLPEWVSAKDIILEMLRRHGVKGGIGKIIEYYGDGLKSLSAMDRHVIANMGAELGATSTVFPSDNRTYRYLKAQGRAEDWVEIISDKGCEYDLNEEIILDDLEPLIALPSSPGNVVAVKEVSGRSVNQVVIGSSANPGLRDFWIAGYIVKDKTINNQVSLDINPTSRQLIQNMIKNHSFANLIKAGARFHQSGCMGCIGMGQAPSSNTISLRTMPRNFPGRSGTENDQVYLCSPETAAASALTGKITDPRDLGKLFNIPYSKYTSPEKEIINTDLLAPPLENGLEVQLKKGPNIKELPHFSSILNEYNIPVLLKMGDNISTDEILRAGADVLPFRSNIPEISKYTYSVIDVTFYNRAIKSKPVYGGHVVIAGENYAQGSSREHAALAPKYLGQVCVIARSYARIAWQNLINFGILPLEFINEQDYSRMEQGNILGFKNLRTSIRNRSEILISVSSVSGKLFEFETRHSMSNRQVEILLKGGIISEFKEKFNR
ncbi:aconitate hydratase [Zhouia amylolytica]|uniref:Aconitate hydratase n=1 Tax=Zhouia amylolytica AD3 TaxID=1286632 RepID=W2USZ6_9FLAO|nr:aconitate hydratase [Zhouia amylolytica]ETN97094.1 aconitate hydratase [Zhouia amylolytica AD3]